MNLDGFNKPTWLRSAWKKAHVSDTHFVADFLHARSKWQRINPAMHCGFWDDENFRIQFMGVR